MTYHMLTEATAAGHLGTIAAICDRLGGTPADWALDSHRAAVKIFDMQPRNDVLDDAYLAKARPILDRQLAVGGMRLAHLLNQAFAAKRCK